MQKCKHKHREERNIIREDYYIVEYDIICAECGKYLGHWAYGLTDIEYYLNYELKGIKKIRAKLEYYIINSIKAYFADKKAYKSYKNNDDLPF